MIKIVRFPWRNEVKWGILEKDRIFALEGDLYGNFGKGKELCQLKQVKLLAPVQPSITVACGMNW